MKEQLEEKGYLVLNDVFSAEEVTRIKKVITDADSSGNAFRKKGSLFAIRRFLQEVPGIASFIFTPACKEIIATYGPEEAFVTKSIYFDKPEQSNWFVAYHQDLTISVDRKIDMPGFGPWTLKPGQYAVQPPLSLLEQNITLRIHLDDTDESNGALKVIPGSHRQGICRPEHMNHALVQEDTCCLRSGGVMLMKPLLLHASARSTAARRRRVMHLEFSNTALPEGLNWSERRPI